MSVAEESWETVESPEDDESGGTQRLSLSRSPLPGPPTSSLQSPAIDHPAHPLPAIVDEPPRLSIPNSPKYIVGPEPGSPEMCDKLRLAVKTDLMYAPSNDVTAAEETSSLPGRPSSPSLSTITPPQDYEITQTGEGALRTPIGACVEGRGVTRDSSKLFEQLNLKRMAVLGLRAQYRESRNNLRFHRESLLDQDAILIQRFSVIENSKLSASELVQEGHEKVMQLLTTSRTAREDLQQLEIEHNHLEDQLDRQEWELKQLEERAYGTPEARDVWDFGRLSKTASIVTEHPPSAVGSDSVDSRQHNLQAYLTHKYLSRNGDAYLIEEELHSLRAERAQLHEEERIRHRVGHELTEEDRDFLASFDRRHDELQRDLQHVREDILEIKFNILDQDDVLFQSDHLDEELARVESNTEDDILCDGNPARHPLLLKDEDDDPEFHSGASEKNDSHVHMPSFINLWLLLILRRSSMEIRLFLNIFEIHFQSLHLTSSLLTSQILKFWTEDGTAQTKSMTEDITLRPASLLSRHSAEKFTTRSCGSHSAFTNGDRLRLRLAGVHNPAFQSTESMIRELMTARLTHTRSKSC